MIRFLEHKWTANIVGIINALAAIAAVIVTVWLSQTTGATGPQGDTGTHWTRTDAYWVITICVLVLSNGGHFTLSLVRRNKIRGHEVIRKLSALQESYILTPQYVTAMEHGDHSKESALSKGGTADILTNSLKYDMFYSIAIAKNIIRGSRYVYILPKTSFMIEDLGNYIRTICESIQKELTAQGVHGAVAKLDELRSENLEFWFFNNANPCLYNFAIFRQTAEGGLQPYVQYWWYINPSDTRPDSHMLAYEIQATRDRGDLDEVFGILKKSASKKSGQDVFNNRHTLTDWIGGQQ